MAETSVGGGRSAGLSTTTVSPGGGLDAVLDRWGRGDQVEVELALEALADDLHVQQPEEPAAEPEPERARGLGLVGERAVVEAQLLEGVAQVVELVAVDRVEPAEHHRLGFLVALERFGRGAGQLGDGLARACLADVLDAGDEIADLARAQGRHRRGDRPSHADLERFVGGAGVHELELRPGAELTVHHPHRGHHAAVLVEVRVEDQRLERRVEFADGRRDALDDGVEQVAHTLAGLGGDPQDLIGRQPEDPFDLLGVGVGIGRGQVDLVEAGDDLEVVLERQIAVGQGLGLDALAGVDDEDHSLAGGERARHLVAEVDVARRVDEVDDVVAVVEVHRLQLDGDAPLALEVHRVEVLLAHVTGVDGAADLEDAIRERRLAVVDVGDDRQVADSGEFGHIGPSGRPATLPTHDWNPVTRARSTSPSASPAAPRSGGRARGRQGLERARQCGVRSTAPEVTRPTSAPSRRATTVTLPR